MKKFILIFLISIFSYTNSFALSKKGEKEMYGGCYPEALHLGKKRAKQYCTCAVKMVSKKYSDDDVTKIMDNGEGYKLDFAIKHCNTYPNAF